MSETSVTVETPESQPSPASEPETNEHDVAIAEAEAASEIAVAEIEAEAQQTAAEILADALETEAVRTVEEENEWLKERVAYLEGRLEGQQNTQTLLIAETPNPSTPQPSETMGQEAETTGETISIPQSTSGETVETLTEVIPESVAESQEPEVPPARRKRRLLI